MDDAVAHRESRGDKPIPVGRRRRMLADRKRQLGQDSALDLSDIALRRGVSAGLLSTSRCCKEILLLPSIGLPLR